MLRCVALAVLLTLAGLQVAVAAPLARVEGIEDVSLRNALREALGEADGFPEDRWRAREQARDAADRARRFMESRGYYAAVVDPRLDDEGRPLIRVRPGAQFTFQSAQVIFDQPPGAREPDPETRAALGLSQGDPVIARDVIDARARVLAALRRSGYPEAEEGDHEIIVDHAVDAARADFLFRTGEFITFGDPEFAGGLAELDPDYIDRLAPFEVGEPASAPALSEFASRLQGLEAIAVADARLAPPGVTDAAGNRLVDVRADPAPVVLASAIGDLNVMYYSGLDIRNLPPSEAGAVPAPSWLITTPQYLPQVRAALPALPDAPALETHGRRGQPYLLFRIDD